MADPVHVPQCIEHNGEAGAETKGYCCVSMIPHKVKNEANIFDNTVHEANVLSKIRCTKPKDDGRDGVVVRASTL